MKLVFLTFFLSSTLWARPTVLVGYFDPFGRARINNSGTVSKLLLARARSLALPFELKLCELPTKFDVSVETFRDCLAALPVRPKLVIGLGETGCEMKAEIMGRNLDRTIGPDNAGVERNNTPIDPQGPRALGFTYPLAEMVCALGEEDRGEVRISNNAGSFVCNNLAYQMAREKEDFSFGFIHVPSNSCRNLTEKNKRIVEALLTMINRGFEITLERVSPITLPVLKDEFDVLRKNSRDECVRDFWKGARAFDEKKRLF